MWQRGDAWSQPKQILLIDSIIRGMDIPKIYFRERVAPDSGYDVVDGQQRLRAIWDFLDEKFSLKHPQSLQPVDGEEISEKSFTALSPKLQARLQNFKVSLAIISDAETHEITLLFARLQLAAPLNSAELRNAIMGPLRNEVDATALMNSFFDNCRISSRRMKHQDYTAHAYALAINGVEKNLKAPELRELYETSTAIPQADLLVYSQEVDKVLVVMQEINESANGRITQKWMFCDIFFFVLMAHRDKKSIDVGEFASTYVAFDTRRLDFLKRADELLEGNVTQEDQDLFDYIQAFRIEGGSQANLEARAKVFERLFVECVQ